MEWLEWLVLNWRLVLAVIIALAFVLFIGGHYRKLKKEIAELVEAIKSALDDGDVDDAELALILKEGKDVGRTIKEITLAVTRLLPRR